LGIGTAISGVILTDLWGTEEFLGQFNGDLQYAIVGLCVACLLNFGLLASALFRANKIKKQVDELQRSIQALPKIEENRLRRELSRPAPERPNAQ
jgi:hypothetical protein